MASKTRHYTPEELKILEGMGFTFVYENKCMLCGKKFTSKNEERLQKRLEEHVDTKCPMAKWTRTVTKILEIAGLKNVINADLLYLADGTVSKGHERVGKELEILNDVKNMLDNWGKEEEEEKNE